VIRDINKGGSGDIRELEKDRAALRKAMDDNQSTASIRQPAGHATHKPSDFTVGSDVRIISMDLTGHVHTKPDQKGNLTVQCGIMNINTNISDLELIASDDDISGKSFVKRFGASSGGLSKSRDISSEINLSALRLTRRYRSLINTLMMPTFPICRQ
jgi:hypothetical protein